MFFVKMLNYSMLLNFNVIPSRAYRKNQLLTFIKFYWTLHYHITWLDEPLIKLFNINILNHDIIVKITQLILDSVTQVSMLGINTISTCQPSTSTIPRPCRGQRGRQAQAVITGLSLGKSLLRKAGQILNSDVIGIKSDNWLCLRKK